MKVIKVVGLKTLFYKKFRAPDPCQKFLLFVLRINQQISTAVLFGNFFMQCKLAYTKLISKKYLICRRFSKIFIIGLPSPSERTQIFKKFLDQYNKVVTVNYDLINFDCIQKCSEGYINLQRILLQRKVFFSKLKFWFYSFTGDDIRKVVSLTANNNCKVSSNGKLLQYKDIENIRHQLGI